MTSEVRFPLNLIVGARQVSNLLSICQLGRTYSVGIRNTQFVEYEFIIVLPPFPKDLLTYFSYKYQGKSSCIEHGVSKVGKRKRLR